MGMRAFEPETHLGGGRGRRRCRGRSSGTGRRSNDNDVESVIRLRTAARQKHSTTSLEAKSPCLRSVKTEGGMTRRVGLWFG